DAVNIVGTSGPDNLNFDPTDATSGQVTRTGTVTTASYANLSGTPTVGGGTGGFDVLTVLGTGGADTVTSTATTVTRDGAVTIGAGIDQLDINTLGGSDNITLTGLALPVIVDAGAGNDIVDGSAMTVRFTAHGGAGDDVLTGGTG